MEKVCTKCKILKDYSYFCSDKRALDGKNSACKSCEKKRAQDYLSNPDNLKKRNASCKIWAKNNKSKIDNIQKNFRIKRRDILWDLKKKSPCTDCGYYYHPVVMDYDHVSDDKSYEVGKMKTHKQKTMLEEISKCELVCSNCHRIRTAIRAGIISKNDL